jgi:hypothetical protein
MHVLRLTHHSSGTGQSQPLNSNVRPSLKTIALASALVLVHRTAFLGLLGRFGLVRFVGFAGSGVVGLSASILV